jgi:heme-degrading monooxygenase HmoA
MFARVSRYHGDSDRLMEGFRHTVEPIEQMEGFVQASFLIDPETSRAVTVTLWGTRRR